MPAAFLMKILAVLGLLLMPMGMAGGASAMPHHQASAAGSGACDEAPAPHAPTPAKSADCAMACSALPTDAPRPVEKPQLASVPERPAASAAIDGIQPEAAIPPPRSL
jgi:hypothetical protein